MIRIVDAGVFWVLYEFLQGNVMQVIWTQMEDRVLSVF